MKKIKKLIAVMLLSLTLFNSIFSSYSMTVQAAEAIPISTALEAFLALFGLELGLGNQSNFLTILSLLTLLLLFPMVKRFQCRPTEK